MTLRKEDLYEMLQHAMQKLRLDFGATLIECIQSSRSVLLMVLHLFLSLPNLIPKTKIEFVGDLGSPIYKKIELRNPSKRKVIYEVTLTGSSDFSVETNTVTIPPESGVEFIVTLNAKFFDPVEGKLIFWGVRDGGLAGPSTLAFQLSSKIVGRKPVDKLNKTVQLFDLETIPLQIKNPFNKDGNFQLKLQVIQSLYSVEEIIKSTSTGGAINGAGAKPKRRNNEPKLLTFGSNSQDLSHLSGAERKALEEDMEIEMIFKSPFWCNEETVAFINGRPPRTIQLYMLPFLLGKYTCQLVFIDKVLLLLSK